MQNSWHNILIHPHQVDKYKQYVKDKNWKWAFFGDNPVLRERIIQKLGDRNRFFYAFELNDIALRLKQNFLTTISNIGKKNEALYWWASVTSYKTPLAINLFANYCYYNLIQDLLINKDSNNYLIIIENPFLYEDVRLRNNSPFNRFTNNHLKLYLIKTRLKLLSFLKANYFPLKAIRRYIKTKEISKKYNAEIQVILSKLSYDVLMCTWIEDRSFNKVDGTFEDPYLKGLSEISINEDKAVLTTTLPFFPVRLIEQAIKSKAILPIFLFGNIADIIKAYLKILKYKLELNDGINCKNIITFEMLNEKGRVGESILHYFLFKKVLASNLSFGKVFYPFENQPYERMLCMAIQESNSNIVSIGYQHASIPSFSLNFFLGSGEGYEIPQPRYIVANSKYYKEVLIETGFTAKVINGGSLRFKSIPRVKIRTQKKKSDIIKKKVLVILSYSVNYSSELLYFLVRKNNADMNFLIKPHPDFPEEVIRHNFLKFPKNFIFVKGNISDFFDECDWVIHVGSNAALEAINYGILSIKYLPERIDLDPLVGTKVEQVIISDKDELHFEQYNKKKEILKRVDFEPVNKKIWIDLLREC
jgi:hypothetical protein